jgi:transcriptional regulator with XRE-family HTH domain
MDNNLNNIEIGERIRSIREGMLLSREKFSEIIDISEVFLGQIERGECSLSLKTLANIVAFSGSSTDFILFGSDSQNSQIKKINRILKTSSDDTIEFIYNLINDVYRFNKKNKLKK